MSTTRKNLLAGTAAAGAALLATAAGAQSPPPANMASLPGATLLALYKHPKDPKKFDDYYATHHAPLAQTLPSLTSYTLSTPLPASSPYYLVATLLYPSLAALQASLASQTGKAVVADLENFATEAGVDVITYANQPS